MSGIKYNMVSYPVDQSKSAVLMVHGYGEHIGRYDKLAKRLNQVGCNVYGFDFRGHGLSSGSKGAIVSFLDYIVDLDHALSKIHEEKIKIYSHSMGALVVAYWLIHNPKNKINEVVFSSGLFKLDDSFAPMLRKIVKYLSVVAPWLKTAKIDSKTISRVPQEIQKYNNDPLINRGGTRARTGYELMLAMDFVLANASKITKKAMVITGDTDKLTNMSGSEELYEKLSSEKKSIHIIEGGYHELINDECEEKYTELVVSFLCDN